MEMDIFLKDWIITLIKHKDLVKKSIQNIKNSDNFDFVVNYREEQAFYLVKGILEDVEELMGILNSNKDKNVNIILINDKKNLDFLIANWKLLSEFNLLSLYFINPFSETEKHWVIRPYVHNRICDEASLKTGLKAMFQGVDKISMKVIEEKTKGL